MSNVKTCGRCGRRLTANVPRVYSSFTGSYYCAAIGKCAKRARRVKKVAA